MNLFEGLRIVCGVIFVLFLPGLAMTYIFFPPREIEGLERMSFSIALSIITVPLAMFVMSKMGISLSPMNIFFGIFSLVIIFFLTFVTKQMVQKK